MPCLLAPHHHVGMFGTTNINLAMLNVRSLTNLLSLMNRFWGMAWHRGFIPEH